MGVLQIAILALAAWAVRAEGIDWSSLQHRQHHLAAVQEAQVRIALRPLVFELSTCQILPWTEGCYYCLVLVVLRERQLSKF